MATAAPSALSCSIYSVPDGPAGLETGGSNGSGGSATSGGSPPSGGSDGEGGSPAGAGSASGGEGGSSGTSSAGDGGATSNAGVGGSAGTDGGSSGSGGATAGAAGSSAGTSGSGGSGGSGAIVNLALGKPAAGSGEQLNHPFVHGNDGDMATRWCANAFTFPQHYTVDLGASYELTGFEITWEMGNRDYTYEVATSEDNQSYVVQDTRTEIGRTQTGSMLPGSFGRYARVTVTATVGNTWASFFEFNVFGR